MTTTREESEHVGRVTTALYEGKIQDKLKKLDAEHDRVMICGSMPMNLELKEFLESKGFKEGTMKEHWKLCTRKGICRMSGQRRF